MKLSSSRFISNSNDHHFHFIGIGGIGMSGLAKVLKKRGYSISGSDKCHNKSILELEKLGITIYNKQSHSNISDIREKVKHLEDLIIIVSSAIPINNEELQYANKEKLQIFHRSDILAWLIKKQKSILVAGSHGKTTTSTILTTIFASNNQDPTAVIGGIVPFYKSNAHSGKGKFLIAEIDESDGSITKFSGDLAVITNLELDHTDHYHNLESIKNTIKIFTNKCKVIIANYDCLNLKDCFNSKVIWWSTKTNENVNFSAIPITMTGKYTTANYYEEGNFINKIKIYLPGLHNLNNTLGAIAASRVSGISFDSINKNLHNLETPKRRFEFKGIWNGRAIIDDYAHHPSEIKETISMARLIINSKESRIPIQAKRLVIIFQPHRYSRIKDMIEDFANNLGKADMIFLTPIYSAGEAPIKEINSETISIYIKKKYPNLLIFNCKNLVDLKNSLEVNTQIDDLLIIMGAGDIFKFSEKLNKQDPR